MNTIEEKAIVSQFEKIGAKVKISEGRDDDTFRIDVRNFKNCEEFILVAGPNVDIKITNAAKELKHLLLNVNKGYTNEKYLCGHDERHWFSAAVPIRSATTVQKAMEALKPQIASATQKNVKVKNKNINKRHNKGYKRQGEWFFIPQPHFIPDKNFTFKKEPITRGRSKPHICELLCRKGGEPVMVSRDFPNGLTIPEYDKVIKESNGNHRPTQFRRMTRDAQVFVTGKISHPDHKTLILKGWHLVVPNTESDAPFAKSNVFLD